MSQPFRKKLIEVALPLEAINREAAREKSIRHGHPSTLHLWWARRPLAACRAVLFASLVDDPSSHPELFPSEEEQDAERQRLFLLIERLVKWESGNDEEVLASARKVILASTGERPPTVYDPFCGGGSIPLEAQRLGLVSQASDLNPVAVLMTKALIEIPAAFSGTPPVNPQARAKTDYTKGWRGAQGLADDVRYFGRWMHDEAFRRIGRWYPKVVLPKSSGGGEATVIAWLWARTVNCLNPSCRAQLPLVRSFTLATKKGKEAHIEPVVAGRSCSFQIAHGGPTPPGTVDRRGARCLVCSSPVPLEHIRAEGVVGRLGARMMAIVAEGKGARIYLPPTAAQERIAEEARPMWSPETEMTPNSRYLTPTGYGMMKHSDMFTPRQLLVLGTLSDLVEDCRRKVILEGGSEAYALAVATYLGLGVARYSNACTAVCTWNPGEKKEDIRFTFSRQALSMTWDFAEGNPFSSSSGNLQDTFDTWIFKVLTFLPPALHPGKVRQVDAGSVAVGESSRFLFSTDPPYYDNVPYADLSDFFYLWLRKSLGAQYPELLATMLVPKAEELVADPVRHGGKHEARLFFERGMGRVLSRMREASSDFPATIFYAFKQTEGDEDDDGAGGTATSISSTGWETFLQGLIDARWQVVGTWPMRTERNGRTRSIGSNALATSVVLVCRVRPAEAPIGTRTDLLRELRSELPKAVGQLQHGNIAPVDLAQAAIGPGMAVFSRYSSVVETNGKPMSVSEALAAINQVLDDVLAQQEGDFDTDTRWALSWFEQMGFSEGRFGDAETLSRAKNTSVVSLEEANILRSRAGRVALLRPEELGDNWEPEHERMPTAWETVHQLVRSLNRGGEVATAELVRKLGSRADSARELAYRLYTVCERKKRAPEALSYNSLVQSWPEIVRLAHQTPASPDGSHQPMLFGRN